MISKDEIKRMEPELLCEILNKHFVGGGTTKNLSMSNIDASWGFLLDIIKEKYIHKMDDKYYTLEQLGEEIHKPKGCIDLTKDDIDVLRLLFSYKKKLVSLCDSYEMINDYIIHGKKQLNLLPSKKLRSTSIRVDDDTWKRWDDFCNTQYYKRCDLISRALQDFIDRYKK